MKGRPAPVNWCKACATRSLPTPDSPVISTDASLAASRCSMASICRMAGDRPREPGPSRLSGAMRAWIFSTSASRSKGLVM